MSGHSTPWAKLCMTKAIFLNVLKYVDHRVYSKCQAATEVFTSDYYDLICNVVPGVSHLTATLSERGGRGKMRDPGDEVAC